MTSVSLVFTRYPAVAASAVLAIWLVLHGSVTLTLETAVVNIMLKDPTATDASMVFTIFNQKTPWAAQHVSASDIHQSAMRMVVTGRTSSLPHLIQILKGGKLRTAVAPISI